MKANQEKRQLLGLAMIMKDEVDELKRIIKDYGKYFDKIYVTVTDKKTYSELSKIYPATNSLIEISYFKWVDHFGKARNYNQQQIRTNYWMWIDTDDEIQGAENLPAALKHMIAKNIDDLWFPYDYVRKVNSTEHETMTWRERIIKTSSSLKWSDDTVHEHINATGKDSENFLSSVLVKHRRTIEQQHSSRERNILILEKDWTANKRVSTAYYLGATYKDMGNYPEAIEKLLSVTEQSEGAALKFKAWQLLFECYFQMDDFVSALAATDACIAITPDHPDSWYQRFAALQALGNLRAALEVGEIAMSKKIDPEGELAILVGYDPSLQAYRGPFSIAQCYITYGNVARATEIYETVKEVAPQYVDEMSLEAGIQWDTIFYKPH